MANRNCQLSCGERPKKLGCEPRESWPATPAVTRHGFAGGVYDSLWTNIWTNIWTDARVHAWSPNRAQRADGSAGSPSRSSIACRSRAAAFHLAIIPVVPRDSRAPLQCRRPSMPHWRLLVVTTLWAIPLLFML